ncbi:MAG: AAA family ATPase [Azonexus sp.]
MSAQLKVVTDPYLGIPETGEPAWINEPLPVGTLFQSTTGNRKVLFKGNWQDLFNFLSTETKPFNVKEEQPLISLCKYGDRCTDKGSYRHAANVVECYGVEGDYDKEEVSVESARVLLEKAGIKAILYSSWSSMPAKPRWRVLCPYSKAYPPAERERLVARLNGILGGILAGESFTLSQSYFYGRHPTNIFTCLATFDDPTDGQCIDQLDELDVIDIGKPGTASKAGQPSEKRPVDDMLTELLLGEDVHGNALRIVGRMVTQGVDDPTIKATFRILAQGVADNRGEERADALMGDELQRMIDGARKKGFAPTQANAPVSANQIQYAGDIDALFSDVKLRMEDVEKMANAEFLIPDMIVRGHVAAFVAPGNGGKTTIFIYLCEKLVAMKLKVIYINVDGSPGDLKRHFTHASKYGYQVIAPDARDGKSTMDVLAKLRAIAESSTQCDDCVFILDTLKKFVDVIDKRQAKDLYKLMRSLTVKGATICLLGHCNKYKDDDGKAIFEGTADLRNDLDELIYLDSYKNENSNCLEITTRPDKVRAEFSPKSFMIHMDDRSVTEPGCVIKILSKEDRELLGLIRQAIEDGKHSQKDIIAWVKPKTKEGDKKIRASLLRHSQGDNAEIKVETAGRGKDLCYTLPVLFEEIEDEY